MNLHENFASQQHNMPTYIPSLSFAAAILPAESAKKETEVECGSEGRWHHHDAKVFAACHGKEERPELCLMCGAQSSRRNRCLDCKAARYCSPECLRSDVDLHRRICPGRRGAVTYGLAPDTRPSKHHHLAVLLPCDTTVPIFVWLKVRLDNQTGHLTFETDRLDVAQYVAAAVEFKVYHMGLNLLQTPIQKDLAHGVDVLKFNQKEAISTEWLNQCLHSLTKPGFMNCAFGPNIVWAFDIHDDGTFKAPRDVDLRDLRHVVDCHINNTMNPAIGFPERFLLDNMVPSLKVNDLNDKWLQALGVTQQMEMVVVPKDHQAFAGFPVSQMFHLGLRWYLRTAVPICTEPNGEEHPDHEEILDIFKDTMQIEVVGDITKGGYRRCRVVRLRYASSFHLLHVSGRAIHIAHVQALLEYFRLTKRTRSNPSEKGFRAFWKYFKGQEAKRGHPLDSVPSPYDLERGGADHDPGSLSVIRWMQSHNCTYKEFLRRHDVLVADDHAESGLNGPQQNVTGKQLKELVGGDSQTFEGTSDEPAENA